MATQKKTNIGVNNRPEMHDKNCTSSGVFSNIVNISLTTREVFLDFGIAIPNSPQKKSEVELVSRIILTKEHAIELRDVLNRSLGEAYEK